MGQLLSFRSLAAALATGLAAASLSGCMDILAAPDPQRSRGAAADAPDDPDPPRPPAAPLTINEVDYDQAGADTAEFVEIRNPNAAAVDLAAYRVEMVNGSDGRRYAAYTATGRLAAGGYFVIADRQIIDAMPVGTAGLALRSSGLQNGPDAIRVVDAATGRVLDAVHYEKAVPAAGEGRPAPADTTSSPISIGRCPDGSDSGDNGADFVTMPPTPGAANTCAGRDRSAADPATVSGA